MSRFSRYSSEEENYHQRQVLSKKQKTAYRPQFEKSIKIDLASYQQLMDLKDRTGLSMKHLLHESVAGYYEQETEHDR
ncbi:hypothetical protein [Fructobacillus tropaeoli]|uniref:Uncharacterized protein n=1 Tax=Fructobacillus tropaeoli TaxID=709323 RepID=A0ABM9N1I1_9LACO|nr:hypothetical protein [Fructobacillus tropaeoli]GIC69803.1 hypothetical protein FT12353_04410 [Fructobacillus tropaeoli]CAK1253516.1 unnamed protein product [Fructobacillus tropaeoli]CAK1253841.1 unnamed protein product [Fructobacillus tropaeoli]